MELGQLTYLLTVAEEGSFTAAAERLHVSQPAISAQVKKLERELGETLLDRSDSRVAPTDVGAAVLGHARAALAAIEEVRGAALRHTGLLTGRARVGVIGSGVPTALPDLLASFARAHPAVEVSLSAETSGTLLEGLATGGHDVAILGLPGDPPAGIAVLTLLDGPVVAAVAPDDPLASRRRVRLDELVDRTLIVQPPGTGIRSAVDAAVATLPSPPRIAYEAAEPRLLGELALRGLGVALVPESVVPFVPGLVAVALAGPALRARVVLAWPTSRPVGPAGRALVAHLRQGLAAGSGLGAAGEPLEWTRGGP